MMEYSFVGTWNDSWTILDAILQGDGLSLIPDLNYVNPEPTYSKVLNDRLKAMLLERRHLFIWGAAFSLFPPLIKRIDEGIKAGKYFVSATEGGPVLELTLPACYEGQGILNLGPGTLFCPRKTFDPATNIGHNPSVELRAGFREVRNRMKRSLVRYKPCPEIWIGQEAIGLLEQGKAMITGFEGLLES
jgi:hypothetical protein